MAKRVPKGKKKKPYTFCVLQQIASEEKGQEYDASYFMASCKIGRAVLNVRFIEKGIVIDVDDQESAPGKYQLVLRPDHCLNYPAWYIGLEKYCPYQ